MTSNKQISPAIRILRGKRDASARATHLEAATRKFLVTTNERKQMSSKTNFKRIALVAVAALGMGVLSSAPSQAVIPVNTLSVTASTTAGTALLNPATLNNADSTTGALVTVSFLAVTVNTDSVTLTIGPKSKPTAAAAYPKALFTLTDTTSSTSAIAVELESADAATSINPGTIATAGGRGAKLVSTAASAGNAESGTAVLLSSPTANRYVTASFRVFMDTATARSAGSYVYTVVATPYDAVAAGAVSANVKTVDVTITVAAGSTVASSAYSTATLTQGSSFAGVAGSADSVVAVAATASTTTRAVIRVTLAGATGSTATASESVTVTTTLGSTGVSAGSAVGKNVTYAYTAGQPLNILVFSDGVAGTATINISTPSVTFAAKTVTFYSTTATKLTVISGTTSLGTGANTMTSGALGTVGVIWVKATDANGATVVADADGASGVFAYSSAKTIVTDSGTACAYNSAIGYHTCSLTGALAGSATITIANSSTNENLATVKGDKSVAVTVSNANPATVKLAFNKASYAPGEKGYILISVLDSAGKALPGGNRANLLATGGISLSGSFSGTAPTLTDVTYATAARVAAIDGVDSTDAVAILTFYAPYAGTSMKITATGGSLLPASGQVAVSATATVADSGAAALAAVTALATTVASLRTLITTLTNLVLKIQKKVKA
jgi:hypothetical protein